MTSPQISRSSVKALAAASASVVLALVLTGCVNTPSPSGAPTDSQAPSGSSPAAKAGTGDPCLVLPISTLEKITGLSGISSQPFLGKTKNGCHWGSPGSKYSVAYDVLPIIGSADGMIAGLQAASSKNSSAVFNKVDLGNGHIGLVGSLQDSETGVAAATADLFLQDRYALITAILPANSDVGTISVSLGKAFSGVANALPPAPKL